MVEGSQAGAGQIKEADHDDEEDSEDGDSADSLRSDDLHKIKLHLVVALLFITDRTKSRVAELLNKLWEK